MATVEAATLPPARSRRRLALGCGLVLTLSLAGLLLLLVSSSRKAGRLISTGQTFLQQAAGGSLDQAWAMLLPARQQAIRRPVFDAEWQKVRSGLGALTQVEVQGLTAYDAASSSLTWEYVLSCAHGTARCTVRLNPNDDPLLVLGYRISALDSRGAIPQKGDSPAR
ncbi:MAG: hypothetical protein IT204_11810 [Fimbriimonadaceae bacterium]|nr:hypothetical protein [Fimbriimonadaceae bacterium]